MLDLRQFIAALYKANEIVEIHEEVDPHLELAEIHRRVAAADGPALFFKNVKGSTFPVVTNLFGSKKRLSIAFNNRPEDVIRDVVSLLQHDFPLKPSLFWKKRSLFSKLLKVGFKKHKGPVFEQRMPEVDLEKIPLLTSWPQDGGAFITLPLVYTEPPGGGPHNLGMYRIQRYDKKSTGLHWQIGKGGGFHYHQAEKQRVSLPVNIMLGGPPALILSAIAPLPENVPELLLTSFLQGRKLDLHKVKDSPYPVVSQAEFVLMGEAHPFERKAEGPFGDHYGYYSLVHDFPVFRCKAIYHRKNAIYPATVVGKPRQEDFYIGDYLQELLSPLFPLVMPAVRSLWSYGESGFHALSSASVKERYERECMTSAFRILGEGQLSLTKFLLITNEDVDTKDIKAVLTTILKRFRPEKDLFIFSNLSLDTLDYTGPKLNHGSRGILLGVGDPIRDLPHHFYEALPIGIKSATPFCPGCLVLEGTFDDLSLLAGQSVFEKWPLLILVDDIKKTLKSTSSFLWSVFMRFEPAQDIYAAKTSIFRNNLLRQGSILIDARTKEKYPDVVVPDMQTFDLVTKKWSTYFSKPMAMGDSIEAHA